MCLIKVLGYLQTQCWQWSGHVYVWERYFKGQYKDKTFFFFFFFFWGGGGGGGGVQNIHTLLHWYIYITVLTLSTETCMVLCFFFVLLCLEKFFVAHHFSTLSRSSSWRLFRRWWHRDLSSRQTAVPPVGLSAWRSFVFQCPINMIFTTDFTVIPVLLECTWYFLYSLCIKLW